METTRKSVHFASLRVKFALLYAGLTVAVLLLLNIYPVTIYQDLVFNAKESSLLQDQALVISGSLSGVDSLDTGNIESAISLLSSASTTRRIMVTDASGYILYDTSTINHSVGKYALIQDVILALQGNNVFRSAYEEGAFVSRASVPIQYRGVTYGAVYLYEYDADQGQLLLGIQSNLQSISMGIFVTAILMSVIFSWAITRRIGVLLRGMTSVRKGNYSHRIPMSGRDELTQLAGEFNALTDRLQTTDEVRRRFVSDASHELKTPLASICLLTDSILQTEDIDARTAREFVTDIGEEATRLTRITEKLLALTRMDATPQREVQIFPLAPVVSRATHMLALVAQQAEVSLHTNLSPVATVAADQDELYQMIHNLIENAVKYNHPGGNVWVALQERGQKVHLMVSDTGVGIPQEDLEKIFQRFYRVDKGRSREAGGTGLGLSIVHDTVLRHHGTVDVRARVGGGSVFEVVFPSARMDPAPTSKGGVAGG